MIILLYVACFVTIACAVWLATSPEPLLRLSGGAMTMTAKRRAPRAPFLEQLGTLVPVSAARREAWRNSLLYTSSRLNAETFCGLKLLGTAVGAFVGAVILMEFDRPAPVMLAVAAGMGFVAPDLWLRARVAKRQRAILRLLPEAIDLLSLCIGAGLDFLASMNKILAVKKFKKEPLVEELSITLQEIKLGKRRVDALRAMAKRVNLPELSSFVRTIVQAERMGTPISEVLALHSEDVRMQRFTRAERMALKAPVKILLPLIFCIMPCVAIIVGAPIFLQFMTQSPFGR